MVGSRPTVISGSCVQKHVPDEYKIGFSNVLVCISAEEQVAASASLHDLCEAWLVDGQSVAVPRFYSGFIDVNNDNFDLRALQSYLGHGWPADVTGTDAGDLHDGTCAQTRVDL